MKKLIFMFMFLLLFLHAKTQVHVTTDQIWNDLSQLPIGYQNGIIVDPNVNLVIYDITFGMDPGSSIIIEPGAYLRIFRCKIHCTDPLMRWQGIVVKGDVNKRQTIGTLIYGYRPQGILLIRGMYYSNGTTTYAELCNANVGVTVESGGIVRAFITKFRNCPIGVDIQSYTNPDPVYSSNNMCCFDECVFMWTLDQSLYNHNIYGDPMQTLNIFKHIVLNNVDGVNILGCKFYNFLTKYCMPCGGNYPRGRGIDALNSYFIATKSYHYLESLIIPSPCKANGLTNLFYNLYWGISYTGNASKHSMDILENEFIDCSFPVQTTVGSYCETPIIYRNLIKLNKWTTCDFRGVKFVGEVKDAQVIENRYEIIQNVEDTAWLVQTPEFHCFVEESENISNIPTHYYFNSFISDAYNKIGSVNGIKINNPQYSTANISCNIFNIRQLNLSTEHINIDLNNQIITNIGDANTPACNQFKKSFSNLKHIKGLIQGNLYYWSYDNSTPPSAFFEPTSLTNFQKVLLNNEVCTTCTEKNPCDYYPEPIDLIDPSEWLDPAVQCELTTFHDHLLLSPITAIEQWLSQLDPEDVTYYDPTSGVYLPDPEIVLKKAKSDSIFQKDSIFHLVIYPNPAKELFFVNYNFKNNNIIFEVYNVLGLQVYKKQLTTSSGFFYINTEELGNQGTYYLIFKSNDRIFEKKKVLIQ